MDAVKPKALGIELEQYRRHCENACLQGALALHAESLTLRAELVHLERLFAREKRGGKTPKGSRAPILAHDMERKVLHAFAPACSNCPAPGKSRDSKSQFAEACRIMYDQMR
jgi:hypothetical protein